MEDRKSFLFPLDTCCYTVFLVFAFIFSLAPISFLFNIAFITFQNVPV